MNFLKRRKFQRCLEEGDARRLLRFIHEPEENAAEKAWAAFKERVTKQPALLTKPEVYDELHKRARIRGLCVPREEVLDYLFQTPRTGLLNTALKVVAEEPEAFQAKNALAYVGRALKRNPAKVTESLARQENIVGSLLTILAQVETISEPAAMGAIRVIDELKLWDVSEVAHACFQLFCNSRVSESPKWMKHLCESLLPIMHTELVEPLLYQHGIDPMNATVNTLLAKTVHASGEAARDSLLFVVRQYRSTIRSQRAAATRRDPAFFSSQKALDLLSDIADPDDMELAEFLTDMMADTKLANGGTHKRLAQKLLNQMVYAGPSIPA